MDRHDMNAIDFNYIKHSMVDKFIKQIKNAQAQIHNQDTKDTHYPRDALVQAFQALHKVLDDQRQETREELENIYECNVETRVYHTHSHKCSKKFISDTIK